MKSALVVFAIAWVAQAQTGEIQGTVVDAATHQPVRKANVSILDTDPSQGRPQNPGRIKTVVTDASGAFTFDDLQAGQYELTVTDRDYPETRMGGSHKGVEVSASDAASTVTVELTPGAAVSGRVLDEDGDPIRGCIVQPYGAKDLNRGVAVMRIPTTNDDGSYRMFGIPAGKYVIQAQCSERVFQPRPLSAGPDPPPSAAYPPLFYPAARDAKSAEVLDLSAGAEKSGINFEMRPVPVTYVHGTFAGSADWRGRDDVRVELVPLDSQSLRGFGFKGGEVNPKDGSFNIGEVFPGSYHLVAFSQDFSVRGPQSDAPNRIGGIARVDVVDKPVQVSLQLQQAFDIPGRIEIERDADTKGPIKPNQINIQLRSETPSGGLSPPVMVNDDGTFTIKSVLPGEWRIVLFAPSGFMKSAWLGSDDVANRTIDLESPPSEPLRIAVSTNTGSIQGTAPLGQVVFASRSDDLDQGYGWRVSSVDSSGQFSIPNLAPGKYRVTIGDTNSPMPEEGGQEVTVSEGETAMVELKAGTKP